MRAAAGLSDESAAMRMTIDPFLLRPSMETQFKRARVPRFRKGISTALLALATASAARAGGDWQVWLDQAANKALSEQTAVRVAQSFRYSFDERRLATYYLEAGATWSARPWLALGLGYRQQYDKRDGHWLEENRPFADATLRRKFGAVTISDRNRIEYRDRDGQEDIWRYRNKLTLQVNAWEPGFGLKPYVAAEAFIDESADLKERNRTRFALGLRTDPDRLLLRNVEARWAQALAMDYSVTVQRTKKDDEWTDEYIAGVQIGMNF